MTRVSLFRGFQPALRAKPAHICRANYRWSAETDGGRKRESLYDDNGEPSSGGSGSGGNGDGSNSSAAAGWQDDRWQQHEWRGEGGGGEQQQAWEAAAAGSGRERVVRRRQAGATADSDRLKRRLQRQQQQQQQVPAAGGEAAAVEGAAAVAASAAGEAADDPWVADELRQLRRRQARQAAKGAATGAAAAAAPDPWAEEWGPLEAAPAAAAAAALDYGWAAESWADAGSSRSGDSRRRRQQQQQQEAEEQQEAGAGPGSSWDMQQQQQQQQQQQESRRRRPVGAADAAAAAAAAAAAGSDTFAPGPTGGDAFSGAAPDGQQQQYQQQYGYDDQQYAEDGASWQEEQYDDDGQQYSEAYEPGMTAEPDIALLSSDELERVLPVVPFSQQASFFGGSATEGVQRWGASLALTVVLSKVALLAATSLTWPLWWPWALAAKKNLGLRRQLRYGGLWRTRVLSVTTTGRPKPFGAPPSGGFGDGLLGGSTMRMAKVLIGDPGGAQTEMVLPYDSRYELIQPDDPAELLVLSGDTTFKQFKAVKDVYLPNSGLWVSEYPHADRTSFLEVSLQIEREAQEAEEQYGSGAAPDGQQYDGDEGANTNGGAEQSNAGWQPDGYNNAQY